MASDPTGQVVEVHYNAKVFVFLLALALAGLAYWQRGVAVEQRRIAQRYEAQVKEQIDYTTRNFKVAQKTAESLVLEITHALRNVQGMSPETVRKILEATRATFEQLANSVSTDVGAEKRAHLANPPNSSQ